MKQRPFEEELLTAIDQLIYARQREWSGWIAHNKEILRDLIVATVLDVIAKRDSLARLERATRDHTRR